MIKNFLNFIKESKENKKVFEYDIDYFTFLFIYLQDEGWDVSGYRELRPYNDDYESFNQDEPEVLPDNEYYPMYVVDIRIGNSKKPTGVDVTDDLISAVSFIKDMDDIFNVFVVGETYRSSFHEEIEFDDLLIEEKLKYKDNELESIDIVIFEKNKLEFTSREVLDYYNIKYSVNDKGKDYLEITKQELYDLLLSDEYRTILYNGLEYIYPEYDISFNDMFNFLDNESKYLLVKTMIRENYENWTDIKSKEREKYNNEKDYINFLVNERFNRELDYIIDHSDIKVDIIREIQELERESIEKKQFEEINNEFEKLLDEYLPGGYSYTNKKDENGNDIMELYFSGEWFNSINIDPFEFDGLEEVFLEYIKNMDIPDINPAKITYGEIDEDKLNEFIKEITTDYLNN